MARDTSKKTILREGARLIHAKGFNKTGLQEILNAAQIPKGSFYFYFKSKDDFGLELVDYYWKFIEAMGEKYLSDSSIPPMERLSGFMDAYQEMFENMEMRCGCPIGNLMQEMSDLSEPFREKVGDIYARMHGHIATDAHGGERPGRTPCRDGPGQYRPVHPEQLGGRHHAHETRQEYRTAYYIQAHGF